MRQVTSLPLACSLWLNDGLWSRFLLTGAITAGCGLLLAGGTYRFRRELKPRDGFLLVTLGWLLLPAAAALPLLAAIPGLSFTEAFFEAMSGLTTTGSTVLNGLDSLPPSLNFWRHLLSWIGGLGIIVLAVAVLPLLGVGGMQLYKGQAPGGEGRSASRRASPRRRRTCGSCTRCSPPRASWRLKSAACPGSMPCAMPSRPSASAASPPMTASIAWFDSAAIEFVLMVLMVIASLNFARHFVALRQLSLETYKKDPECKAIFAILSLSVIGIAALLSWHGVYPGYLQSLRNAAFNVISQATTSGLTTQDYLNWPVFAPFWMLFLGCFVCSTGSTGGGIRMFRALLLARQAGRELKLLIHPAAMAPVRIGGRAIPDVVGHAVLAFIFLYFVTVALLIFALLLTGLDFDSAFCAVVASINNTAHGFGAPGAVHNFSSLSPLQTWICTAAMLLGRLEIFSVVVLLRPAYWRK